VETLEIETEAEPELVLLRVEEGIGVVDRIQVGTVVRGDEITVGYGDIPDVDGITAVG
jgi:hypothetical protein